MRSGWILGFLLCLPEIGATQCLPLGLQQEFEESLSFPHQSLTALHDQQGRDYLYVAGMEDGLRIYDISNTTSVNELGGISFSDLNDLAANSLHQDGDYLYVALGNHFSNDQNPGLAVIDVSDPENASLLDVWTHDDPTGGAGVVRVQDNYAYLGGMQHGLFVLDISNKSNVTEVSQFVPDISFPNATNPDPDKYNARGMHVANDLVYLCYDAGGIRIIDVSDKQDPQETGRYSLPEIDNLPRAYNNAILIHNLLYVAIDYCGLEVLDVSDTANITQLAWWNPWDCTSSSLAWFTSPGHTNELAYIEGCNLLGISSGKSEAVFVDISDPAQPVLCDSFGSISSQHGTWGISAYGNTFYLAYIHVPLGIPFFSNWAGIRAVTVDNECVTGVSEPASIAQDQLDIVYTAEGSVRVSGLDPTLNGKHLHITISDMQGRSVYVGSTRVLSNEAGFSVNLTSGLYAISVQTQQHFSQQLFYIP